jgi:OOP family OmpA-OmpF porin
VGRPFQGCSAADGCAPICRTKLARALIVILVATFPAASFFDTNKADILPKSKGALDEIAKLLTKERGLKLRVVGHTDSVGGMEQNLTLSKKRADAVVTALTKEHGIEARRLSAHGVASLAPAATNATEDGRAKNRRVELVPW